MSFASNSGRSSANKRAMIDVVDVSDDDESTNAQPAEKSLKRDMEPVPSQEVLDLRQKVAKLEKDFEGACVYARKFELEKEEKQKRVEFLENLLDKKPTMIDDVKEKKLMKELEKTRERVTALTKELEAERSQANEDRMKDRDRVSFLTKELEVERSRINEDRMNDRARIDELMRKLKQYEGRQHYCTAVLQQPSQPLQAAQQPLASFHQQPQRPQPLQRQPQQPLRAVQQPLAVAPHQASLQPLQAVQQQQHQPPNLMQLLRVAVPQQPLPARSTNVPQQLRLQQPQPLVVAVQKPKLQLAPTPPSARTSSTAVSDSKNIFKLLPHDTPNSITHNNGRKVVYIVGLNKSEMLERGEAVFKGKKLHCSACDETFENGKILEHFLSKEHRHRVVALWPNNAISKTAVDFWGEKIRSISLPDTITVAPPVAVARPVTAANDGASTNEKRAPLVIEIDE